MRLSMRIRVPAAVGEHEYGSNKVHPPRIAVRGVAPACNALSPKRIREPHWRIGCRGNFKSAAGRFLVSLMRFLGIVAPLGWRVFLPRSALACCQQYRTPSGPCVRVGSPQRWPRTMAGHVGAGGSSQCQFGRASKVCWQEAPSWPC